MGCPILDRPIPRTKQLEEPRGGETEDVVQDVLVRLEKLQTVCAKMFLLLLSSSLLEESAPRNKRGAGGGPHASLPFQDLPGFKTFISYCA